MDILLEHTADGGEITIENGRVKTTESGLETSAYLSLFGGNEDDGGGQDTDHLQWWANFAETDLSLRYRSETQYLLRSLPLVPGNLRRIEDAARRDLEWMRQGDQPIATAVDARATIPALNTLKLEIRVQVDGRVIPLGPFEFSKSSSQ